MTLDFVSIESILAIDCGSSLTRTLLIDLVEGEYRLIAQAEAPSTVEPPWNDIMVSVRQTIQQITQITGWQLLDERGQIITPQRRDGGVDAVAATASVGEPMRLLLSGIMPEVSIKSAQRALSGSYTTVEGIISVDRRQGGLSNRDIEGQVRKIQEVKPDAIVLVGGMDGGPGEPILRSAEAIALACSALPKAERPLVIYAGNAHLREQVAEIAGTDTRLQAVDNVRPSMEVENPGPLQVEIEGLYRQKKMERVPGMSTLAAWSPVPVLPSAQALAHSIQYLAETNGINVLGVNVGGSATTAAAVLNQQLELAISSDLGSSHNASRILERVPVESILRWLPFAIDREELVNKLVNKSLRPRTLPNTRQDLLIEQALTREILRALATDLKARWNGKGGAHEPGYLPRFHLIVGGGGVLSNVSHFGQAVLILLDALQPTGVCGLALDKVGLLAPLAPVAMVNPVAAAQTMEHDTLLNLGTVVAPIGDDREGETALTFTIHYQDERSLQVQVPYGSLEVIPLPLGQTATLELRPSRRFDVGLGAKGKAGTTKVEGGLIGIIIDARGRPLPIADDPIEQNERMQRWLWDVGS